MINPNEARTTTKGDMDAQRGDITRSPIQVREIWDHAEFMELGSSWNTLAESTPEDGRVFLRHAWFDACWAWAGLTGRPLVVSLSQGGRPVAFIPLVERRRKSHGLTLRVLEFLAVPDTQFSGIVVHPDSAPSACEAFARWLSDRRPRWDTLLLRNLMKDEPVTSALLDSLRAAGILVDTNTDARNHRIDLAGTWEAYYKTRSRRLKKGNNLVANRLRRAGSVQIHHLAGDQIKAAAIEAVRDVSAASWKRETGLTLDAPGPAAFLERLVAHNPRERWLSLWMLTLDDRIVATELQIQADRRVYALRADYREDTLDLSPGTYLNWKILEALFDDDLATYFMGPGDNSYKFRWTEQHAPLIRLRAWNKTVRGRLGAGLERLVKPVLRSARNKLSPLRNQGKPPSSR